MTPIHMSTFAGGRERACENHMRPDCDSKNKQSLVTTNVGGQKLNGVVWPKPALRVEIEPTVYAE